MAQTPKEHRVGSVGKWLGLQVASKAVSLALGAPAVAAAGMAALAYLDALPLAWAFLATLAAAAFTSVLLNQARAFLLAYSVSGKIEVKGGELVRAKSHGGKIGYGMAIRVENHAAMPLEYNVRRVVGHLEGRLAVGDAPNPNRGSVVHGGDSRLFAIGVAPMRPAKSRQLHGEIDFEVAYGRPGKLNHVASGKFSVLAVTDEDGDVFEARFSPQRADD